MPNRKEDRVSSSRRTSSPNPMAQVQIESDPSKDASRVRSFFGVGALGSALLVIGSVAYIAGFPLTFALHGGSWYDNYRFAMVVPSVFLSCGMALHSFGYLAFFANHRSGLGAMTFVYSITASMAYAILTGAMYQGNSDIWLHFYTVAAYAIMGLAVLLMGIDLVCDGDKVAKRHSLVSTDVLYILSGILMLTFFLAFYVPIAWLFLLPATISSYVGFTGLSRGFGKAPLRARRDSQADYGGPMFCPFCGMMVYGAPYCPNCRQNLKHLL